MGTIAIRRCRKDIMKYTTVKISEIAAHPTMRIDAGYWLKKKKIGPGGPGRVGPQGRKDLSRKKIFIFI